MPAFLKQPVAVVFDCMLFLQATANEKSVAARALDLIESGDIKLFISRRIRREVQEVLHRPEVRARLPRITDQSVEDLFARLKKRAIFVRDVPKFFDYPRDPKDEPYLNLAIAVGASYLVSRDSDLLDLMRWDTEQGRDFQRRFRQLKIVDPLTFLREIER